MTKRKRRILLLVILLSLTIVCVALPLLRRANDAVAQWRCANCLSALGQAMLLYTNENKGMYPTDWGTLGYAEDATAMVFCPSSNKFPPPNITMNQRRDWINANCDFVYLAAHLPSGRDPRLVLAYEKPTSHHWDGINILFQDSHVAFFGPSEAPGIISQLLAHINPPHLQSQGQDRLKHPITE